MARFICIYQEEYKEKMWLDVDSVYMISEEKQEHYRLYLPGHNILVSKNTACKIALMLGILLESCPDIN